jgi:hypothetical protein
MLISPNLHLTYCTNIHAGESWGETFVQLQSYLPIIKQRISPDAPFGVGLRLSNEAAEELLMGGELKRFKIWLDEQGLYVFTLNGFPYGEFHHQRVKDEVHLPNWCNEQRVNYTLKLIRILAFLLPEGMDGGISTSPLSYKPWHNQSDLEQAEVLTDSTHNLYPVLSELHYLYKGKNIDIHLDIEPEPDGMLENTDEVLNYYQHYLIPILIPLLEKNQRLNSEEAEKCIKQHLALCYDVCHFAVGYENHKEALLRFHWAGIRVGKFQISAALKAEFSDKEADNQVILAELQAFNESTYLHQVVAHSQGQVWQYTDLSVALFNFAQNPAEEWRIHFHVPIFLDKYQHLQSTQADIKEVLALLKERNYSRHIEVETYTWEVLPKDLQTDLATSIERELIWVKEHLGN